MRVSRIRPNDVEELVAVWRKIFPDDPPHNDPTQVVAAKLQVDDLILIAEKDGSIVGACMAGYDGHRGWLYSVGVLPDLRRQGIGSQLVQKAIELLKDQGCIKVNLQIRAGNTEVAEFYKTLGFSIEERVSMGRLLI